MNNGSNHLRHAGIKELLAQGATLDELEAANYQPAEVVNNRWKMFSADYAELRHRVMELEARACEAEKAKDAGASRVAELEGRIAELEVRAAKLNERR